MANAGVSVTYDTGRLFSNTLQDKFDSVLLSLIVCYREPLKICT